MRLQPLRRRRLKITHRRVEDDVWGLNNAALRIEENGAEKSDFLYGVGVFQNTDPVTHIERMFDKEENYAGQYFLKAASDQPRQA
jgi:hypothetical protein